MGKYDAELGLLREYLENPSSESAKDHLVFPLFQKLFGHKFKKQSDAEGADIYIDGKLLVELKSDSNDYIKGFYQALHYAKKGLTFSAVCVIARKFIAVWKVNQLPDFAHEYMTKADANAAASAIGVTNANKTTKLQAKQILESACFKLIPQDLEGFFKRDFGAELPAFVQMLTHLDADRIQINARNFIDHIRLLERFFDDKLDAVHCFYAMVGFWDITSKISMDETSAEIRLFSVKKKRNSEALIIKPRFHDEFIKFVEGRFVFTNEGSGLTADYYFGRFDEVIARIKPEYAKQHGIFFTDNNLSKFALWFVREFFEKKLSEKYIVIDPAGGSGNLVTSWKGHLKHKIISELQPDLLKTIERRMRLDQEEIDGGFTIIPKTSKNEGLNFLDKSAEEYFNCLLSELNEKNFKFDKPLAFLVNPPYKNTDENEDERGAAEADYSIHPSIIKLTGNDAGKERYLAFLGQITNLARAQMGDLPMEELKFENLKSPAPLDDNTVETPLLLVFTPTSWLIPRPTYEGFRKNFDKYFKYEKGFIVLGNEFFKINGRFPISFTIWTYRHKESGNKNNVVVKDLTSLTREDLLINWADDREAVSQKLRKLIRGSNDIRFNTSRGDIRKLLPKLSNKFGKLILQPRYDYSVAKKEDEKDKLVSGFPKRNNDNHYKLQRKCGDPKGNFIGFMDDATPVRVAQDAYGRMSNEGDRVWFRLDLDFKGSNKTRIQGGCADNRSYCAYDLPSAKALFTWFAITKALNGRYPVWANQFDIWAPKIPPEEEMKFYSLCFAFGLAENRCVVTKFEKDNPVNGAPEIFVDNPLCPSNAESFWAQTLDREIDKNEPLSFELVKLVKGLYKTWNQNYCKGQFLYSQGLQDEPYFKYFDYADFLTPHSGLIQIKKFAELQGREDISKQFELIAGKTREVKEEIYRLLVDDFRYFE